MFTNGFVDIVSRFKYFEENFDMTRHGFKKMMMYSQPSMILRDDLVETYSALKETMQKEYGLPNTPKML